MDHASPQARTTVHLQYRMIHNIYVLLDDGDRRVLQPFGLTLPQYRVLKALDEEHDLRLTTLSAMLLRAKSTITRLVDHLERDGLVARTSDADDRRAQRLALTPAGVELLQQARAAHENAIAYRFNQALNASEQAQFSDLLTKLHDSLVDTLDTLGPANGWRPEP